MSMIGADSAKALERDAFDVWWRASLRTMSSGRLVTVGADKGPPAFNSSASSWRAPAEGRPGENWLNRSATVAVDGPWPSAPDARSSVDGFCGEPGGRSFDRRDRSRERSKRTCSSDDVERARPVCANLGIAVRPEAACRRSCREGIVGRRVDKGSGSPRSWPASRLASTSECVGPASAAIASPCRSPADGFRAFSYDRAFSKSGARPAAAIRFCHTPVLGKPTTTCPNPTARLRSQRQGQGKRRVAQNSSGLARVRAQFTLALTPTI